MLRRIPTWVQVIDIKIDTGGEVNFKGLEPGNPALPGTKNWSFWAVVLTSPPVSILTPVWPAALF